MNEKLIFSLVMVGIYLIIMLNLLFINVFSRKGVYIGVGIGTDNANIVEVKKIINNYKLSIIVSGIIFSIIIFITSYIYDQEGFSIIALLLIWIIDYCIYLKYNKKLRIWKKENIIEERAHIQRVDLNLSKNKITYGNIPWNLYIIPILLVLIMTVVALLEYESLPNLIPTHWGLTGPPDAYSEKSLLTVLMIPIMSLFTILIIIFANFTILRMKQFNVYQDKELGANNLLRARRYWTYIFVIMAAITIMLLFTVELLILGIIKTQLMTNILTIILLLVGVIVPVYAFIKMGNSGEKLSKKEESMEYFDDEHWYFGGTIYYNKSDSSIFVPKRVGIGSTMNFGNGKAVLIMVLILLLILIFPILIAIIV